MRDIPPFNKKKYKRDILRLGLSVDELLDALVREAELRHIATERGRRPGPRPNSLVGRRCGTYVVLASAQRKMTIQCDCGYVGERWSTQFGATKTCGSPLKHPEAYQKQAGS